MEILQIFGKTNCITYSVTHCLNQHSGSSPVSKTAMMVRIPQLVTAYISAFVFFTRSHSILQRISTILCLAAIPQKHRLDLTTASIWIRPKSYYCLIRYACQHVTLLLSVHLLLPDSVQHWYIRHTRAVHHDSVHVNIFPHGKVFRKET